MYASVLSFIFIKTFASDTIVIVKKKEIYTLTENCKDSISWEETILKKKIQGEINQAIISTVL